MTKQQMKVMTTNDNYKHTIFDPQWVNSSAKVKMRPSIRTSKYVSSETKETIKLLKVMNFGFQMIDISAFPIQKGYFNWKSNSQAMYINLKVILP